MSGASALLAGTAPATTISFQEIPANLLVPGNYLEISESYAGIGALPFPAKVLMLVPILSGAPMAPNVPVQVFSAQQAQALVGQNGIGAQMVTDFLAANPWTPLYIMGFAPPSGATAASWAVQVQASGTLSGPSGPLSLYIGGEQFSVPYTAGVSTGLTMLDALAAAINAANLPVTSNTPITGAANLTLTASDAGTIANLLDVRFNLDPADVTPGGQVSGTNNLSVGVTLTPGTGTPTIADGLAAVAGSWFTHLVFPWTDSGSQTAVATETARRFNAMVGLDMVAFSASTAANLTALVAIPSGNDPNTSILLPATNMVFPPWRLAALYGAVASNALVQDPARQLRSLILPGVVPPASVDILTEEEENQVIAAGGAVARFGPAGTCTIHRAVTTYTTASNGIPDPTRRDIMTTETARRIRFDFISYLGLTYPRNKMSADGTVAAEYDPTIVTPRRAHSSWAARSLLYEKLGWIQGSAATAAQSSFQLDASDPNRLDARLYYQQMNNLMVLAGRLQFTLTPLPAQAS